MLSFSILVQESRVVTEVLSPMYLQFLVLMLHYVLLHSFDTVFFGSQNADLLAKYNPSISRMKVLVVTHPLHSFEFKVE